MSRLSRLALAAVMCAPWPLTARAEDGLQKRGVVQKKEQGLSFFVPPDWPVEERGGLVGPIPVEEYLGMKFKALDARLQGIEQRLQGLDIRVRLLEQNSQAKPGGLKSSEDARP